MAAEGAEASSYLCTTPPIDDNRSSAAITILLPLLTVMEDANMPASPTTLPASRLILVEATPQQPELVVGALLLSWNLAHRQTLMLGVRMAASLRAALLAELPPEIAAELDANGEVELSGVKLIDLDRRAAADTFCGVALLLGDEATEFTETLEGAAIRVVVPEDEDRHRALAEQFPNALLAQLMAKRMHDDSAPPPGVTLSDSQNESARWFDTRYEIIAQGHLNPSNPKASLGKGQERSCRYCGQSEPVVAFSNISHAFPEQIGNKKLIDLRECDTCNAHFAKLEDDFGRWSLSTRSTGRIKGKKNKIPQYQSQDLSVRIKHVNGMMNISSYIGDNRVVLDQEKQEVRLILDQPPYTPMAVFKTFVKMAIAIMPDDIGQRFAPLKGWILEEEHCAETPITPLTLFLQFIPGPLANDQVTYFLLDRNDDGVTFPHLLFVLQYSNYCYQIALPMAPTLHLEQRGNAEMRYFPTPWDTPKHAEEFGAIQRRQIDLSSSEVFRGPSHSLSFSFDSATDITAEVASPLTGNDRG